MSEIPKFLRINNRIRAKKLRVIDENREQIGIISLEEGLKLAKEKNLDLVEVAPLVEPPVCKIMEYSKYKYEQEKKRKLAKKRHKAVHLKEIRVRPKIEEHDYQIKLKQLKKFLNKGHKIKITLFFKGRERAHPELGRRVLERFIDEIKDIGQLEKSPTTIGKNMFMIVSPM